MKKTMKHMLGLLVCLLLSVPVTALAAVYDDYLTLSANNIGLTGDLIGVGVNYNGTSADLIFTALPDGFRIGEIGLNLAGTPTLSGSSAVLIPSTYTDHYAQNISTIGFGGFDGYGKFNNSFTPTATNDPSNAMGWPNSFETVTLTLDWGTTVDSLADILTLNDKNKSVAVHILPGELLKTGFAATSTTPIPAAAWLLGSGLLGLIGIRKRSNS